MRKALDYISSSTHIAPLVVFRIIFGGIMFFSVIRFALKGWIHDQYIAPDYFFTYLGFDWVKPLGEQGMYVVFALMATSFLGVALGFFYRFSATLAFLLFTYVELLDKTNYLNHYYFVSLVCFLLIWVPAHRYFSVDVFRNPALQRTHVPLWTVGVFKLQLGIVYFFAGVAKLNYDWLFRAMPLKLWLPAQSQIPFVGALLGKTWVAFFASWFGAIYDLLVPFFLAIKKYRPFAYFFVIAFHVSTASLFPIGVFPFVMIGATLIFFSDSFHIKLINGMKRLVPTQKNDIEYSRIYVQNKKWPAILLALFFAVQVLLPFRYSLYPGELFWNEEGYRFSWRVMLMEKAGYASFRIKDPETNREWEAKNYDYLTPNQEKMMATQPDMILQFAHFLRDQAKVDGVNEPEVYVDSFVSLNGAMSKPFIDPNVDLAKEEYNHKHRSWILPFED